MSPVVVTPEGKNGISKGVAQFTTQQHHRNATSVMHANTQTGVYAEEKEEWIDRLERSDRSCQFESGPVLPEGGHGSRAARREC